MSTEEQQLIIEKIANEVKANLEGEGSGHDWWHIVRVWNMAKRYATVKPPIGLLSSSPHFFMILQIGNSMMAMKESGLLWLDKC